MAQECLKTTQKLIYETNEKKYGSIGLEYASDNSTFFPAEIVKPENWDFTKLKEFYQKPNIICLSNSLGKIYDHSQNTVNQILCDKVHCDRCRPKIKKRLRDRIQTAMTNHNLHHHIIITAEGNTYRNNTTYQRSYKDMAKAWNKIRKILNARARKQGIRFTYICLPRAQANPRPGNEPGYCHLHIISNFAVPKNQLQKISNKYECTGFIKIKTHTDTSNYLTNDFNNDAEWFIPFGQRHYSCSRNIDLNIYSSDDDEFLPSSTFADKIPISPNKLHIRIDRTKNIIDQVYCQINHVYNYPIPFEEIIKEFVLIKPPLPTPENIVGGLYINGILQKEW